MTFLTRTDRPTLFYCVDDFTDPWEKRPVLLLQHGYGRSGVFWYPWVPLLARHFRVVRPDWRGFGRSPLDFDPHTNFSVDAMLEDLQAVIAESGGGPVHYCGEALGGTLGMLLATRQPGLVRSLTLVSSPAWVPQGTRDAMKFGHASWQEALRSMGTRAWVAAANDSTRFPQGIDPKLIAWYTDEMGKTDVEVMIAMSHGAYAIDARPDLPHIGVPTLGLYPSGGTITSPQEQVIRESIPGIRFMALPTRFHAIQFLMADECARELLAFANEVDERR